MLLLKVTKFTTGHQKLQKKNGQKQHNNLFFWPKGKKSLSQRPSPPQELEVGPRSGPYLLVVLTDRMDHWLEV